MFLESTYLIHRISCACDMCCFIVVRQEIVNTWKQIFDAVKSLQAFWCQNIDESDNVIVPASLEHITKFFKINDGAERPVNPPFTVLGTQAVLGAPVVDNASNVYFVTDSGNLFKMNQNIVSAAWSWEF